jgi:asparagine synthase (glutamine-hydrolysing)
MCGIVGWIKKEGIVHPRKCQDSLERIRHRGPDCRQMLFFGESGVCRTTTPDDRAIVPGNGFFGHARLSIIDLEEASNQPFTTDGDSWIVFNGEIYNYIELRSELEAKGHVFSTGSDTEVMLRALQEEGPRAIRKFNGMWSFAYLDRRNGVVLMSRDRYGKKPLFYSHDGEQMVFGSEFKSLFAILGDGARKLNPAFARTFVETGEWMGIHDDGGCYEGIRSIRAGSVSLLDLKTFQFREVFSDENRYSDLPAGLDEDALREMVRDSVRLRLRSDVPLGVLVSGGVDSSIVAASVPEEGKGNVKFFSGDTGHGNDVRFSQIVCEALGVAMVSERVAPGGDILDLMRDMTRQYELPLWLCGNSIGVFQMYRAMARHGLKVVLDGTGGDEVFGGYFNFYAKSVVDDHLCNGRYAELVRFINDCRLHCHFDHRALIRHVASRVFGGHAGGKTPLRDMQIRDITSGHLPGWLYMNDQNSMAHSMEARSPLLDFRLAGCVSLPVDAKFRDGFNKHLLRRAMPESIPDSVRWRRDKQGFRWLPDDLLEKNTAAIEKTIEDSGYVREHLRDYPFRNGDGTLRHHLWTMRLFCVAMLDEVHGISGT